MPVVDDCNRGRSISPIGRLLNPSHGMLQLVLPEIPPDGQGCQSSSRMLKISDLIRDGNRLGRLPMLAVPIRDGSIPTDGAIPDGNGKLQQANQRMTIPTWTAKLERAVQKD